MEILTAKNLSFTYPNRSEKALDGVSFSLNRSDFLLVSGATGSGKSTLLRLLKPCVTPNGEKSGEIEFFGKGLDLLTEKEAAFKIGFVMQRPEQQIVCDKVEHELAFAVENMGLSQQEIGLRVCETACFFGLEDLFGKSVCELSGGEKQLLNLASVMATQPEILILDEPTAQLDPIAATAFLNAVVKINRELAVTVIIAEHRTEETLPVSNKLLILENGSVCGFGATREVVKSVRGKRDLLFSMPTAVRLYSEFEKGDECPLDIREGREYLNNNFKNEIDALPERQSAKKENVALEFSQVFFRYSRFFKDVLRGLSFEVFEKEFFCILGGNGAGKTTALNAAAGLVKPYAGSIKVFSKKLSEYKNQSLYRKCLTLLPQDAQTVFLRSTLREEFDDLKLDLSKLPFDLTELLDMHPFDLSGGQMQQAALAKALAAKPKILLLDEPTKGLDAFSKQTLLEVLKKLQADGLTIVCVTHDLEFAALAADRCALLFNGGIVSCLETREFFTSNAHYTTSSARISKGFFKNAVTFDDLALLCQRNGEVEK